MPVLSTVRNTGSHTAHNIFRDWEMHYLTEDKRSDKVLWFGHCEPGRNLPLIGEHMESDGPLILTMRNPVEVWKSWRKRNKPPDNTFRQMWSALFSLKETFPDSFWLPMDTEDRDVYLDMIEERLGEPVNRDWTRKGVYQMSYDCEGGMTLEEALEFFATLPFEQFNYADIS